MSPSVFRPGIGSLPAGRTGHACAQCRRRKQKCGGFTSETTCRPCLSRRVKCSFEEEVMDLRHNPYFRMSSPKSPSARESSSGANRPPADGFGLSPAAAALIPALTALDGQDGSVMQTNGERGPYDLTRNGELPQQVQSLTSRISELERRLESAQREKDAIQQKSAATPRPHPSFTQPLAPAAGPTQQTQPSPLLISPVSFPNSGAYSFSSSPGAAITDGPLKTLTRFQPDESVEVETHDPIPRLKFSEAEAHVMFKLFFSHGHPNAPFLDVDTDSDPANVRSRSILLFLAILSVGARFWSAPSKTSCWLHPRYPELVQLLDAEIMRVTLRPKPQDDRLETVQALIICAHWMPLDISADRERYRSRFSEAGAWHCLGLAIRWAASIELERRCCTSFKDPETVVRRDAHIFRTVLYLTESDHYLALSARRPSCLDPGPLNEVMANFSSCQFVQSTDRRLISLFQVAKCAHQTDCRPITVEDVDAFDQFVQLVERQFTSQLDGGSTDAMVQHFPSISLRWYRLSYTCAFLDNATQGPGTRKVLLWAVDWAAQILVYLSAPSCRGQDLVTSGYPLDPDPAVVRVMSYAIDHYFVVISYAVFFLVNSWLRNFIDLSLRPQVQQPDNPLSQEPRTSFLFRLVDIAARTLESASPPEGHLARRYVPLLRGMADIVLLDTSQSQNMALDTTAEPGDANALPDQLHANLGEDLWGMWQQAGLEPINWSNLLDDIPEG